MSAVSLITPTFNRASFLVKQYVCVAAQTHSDWEWRILDDSPTPNEFFTQLNDPRVHYRHQAGRLSIGAKRNAMIADSKGEWIVQLDDDDYYSAAYVDTMVQALADEDFVTLGGWFAFDVAHQVFAYWDTTFTQSHQITLNSAKTPVWVDGTCLDPYMHSILWGYGFTYAFRRRAWETARFPDQDIGEDYEFVKALFAAGLRLKHFPDYQGLVLHCLHPSNTSRIFPQYVLPTPLVYTLFGPEVEPFVRPPA